MTSRELYCRYHLQDHADIGIMIISMAGLICVQLPVSSDVRFFNRRLVGPILFRMWELLLCDSIV